MIQSFGDDQTELVWQRRFSPRLPRDIQRVALRKLYVIHRSRNLNDLRVPPANRLEKLKASRAGRYSIRINDQWRICFRWVGTDAYEVEIVDYH